LAAIYRSPAAPAADAAMNSGDAEPSTRELSRELVNPVSALWVLRNQFDNFKLANGRWNNIWNFQPALPLSWTKDWNLVTRPMMPFYNISSAETAPGAFERSFGLGDLTLLELLSPKHTGNWTLGAGPSFVLPTATSTFTGQGKWQAGPGLWTGYRTQRFILGAFPQQWWSIGGDPHRPNTNQLNLQPIAAIFFGDGWDIGYSGNILANWTASRGNVWTVPVGVNLGKVVKLGPLPVKAQLAVQYMAVHPQGTGQAWNIQIQLTPIIPEPIKGPLF
jgi:hypothetical protein